MLAVGTEEGIVNFINAGESTQWDAGTSSYGAPYDQS